MNEKRLRIYLEDHLALMVGERELIGRCLTSNREAALARFLQRLKNEVEAEKSVCQDVRHRLGGGESFEGRLKTGAAWFAEKLGRFKLNDTLLHYSPLSRLIELETLAAAAAERISLWDTLDAIRRKDSRLDGISFAHFRDQAREHLQELDRRRRFAASEAFDAPGEDALEVDDA